MIQDDLKDFKSQNEKFEKKLKLLESQKKTLEIKLEEVSREAASWKDFAQAFNQVDVTMKGIKSQLQQKMVSPADD